MVSSSSGFRARTIGSIAGFLRCTPSLASGSFERGRCGDPYQIGSVICRSVATIFAATPRIEVVAVFGFSVADNFPFRTSGLVDCLGHVQRLREPRTV
jgi:hypothetical protein